MSKISVAVATFNEEENIEACLSSVKEFAFELVVVDGRSTDKTREIAKKLGARVIKTTNKPMFHTNKNLAI
ncbi:glycosyltransferase, partial [Patescibacteria group bacterium]|nr:glycosyltransferase [Patescibacteria group bacterium]